MPFPNPPVQAPIAKTLALTFVLNTGVAVVLWLLVPAMGELANVWVSSQCVGYAITLLAIGISRVPAVARLPRMAALLVMLVPAGPLGYLLGMRVAGWIYGRHVDLWPAGPIGRGAWLATLLATALAGLVLWGRERIRAEAAAREHAQRLATESELRLLRAQLEPHMLFNTLANLRELMNEDPRAAQAMLDSLIVFLRHTLAATRRERTTLEQEFAHLEAYLSLMAVRMGKRLQWRVDLPAALRAAALPPMLLQPLVENAVQHGVEPQVGPGAIHVAAARQGDEIEVSVADTGRGMPAQGAATGGSSYGLAHVRERLRAEYGSRGVLELEANTPRGVLARVRFPA